VPDSRGGPLGSDDLYRKGEKIAMMNWIWLGIVIVSILTAAFTGQMPQLTQRSFTAAREAVELAISLVGVMAFWLGVMRVAQDAGLLAIIARALRRPMKRLFPDIPAEHPALSAMIMNIAANLLGLGNAATPFGIKAMQELDRLNTRRGVASDSMCLFLAINTSGLSLFPTGVIAARVAAGSQDPACIWLPTIISTVTATVVGVAAAFLYRRLRVFSLDRYTQQSDALAAQGTAESNAVERPEQNKVKISPALLALVLLCAVLFLVGAVRQAALDWESLGQGAGERLLGAIKNFFSYWAVPALMGGLLLFGLLKKVKVYESLIEGAKDGFSVAIKIIPYLVAIMVAVGMFQASGAMSILEKTLGKATELVGLPAAALPMALLRPLSGSGAFGYMNSVFSAYGVDSLTGKMVSVMQGSTETTLYVLAVYFGAVGISRVRHALAAGLTADLAGLATAVAVSQLFF